jgi:hypothetical protein
MSDRDSLLELLKAFDGYVEEREVAQVIAALARQRLIEGHRKFGEDWLRRGIEGNLREALEERADLVNYEFFAWMCNSGAKKDAKEF